MFAGSRSCNKYIGCVPPRERTRRASGASPFGNLKARFRGRSAISVEEDCPFWLQLRARVLEVHSWGSIGLHREGEGFAHARPPRAAFLSGPCTRARMLGQVAPGSEEGDRGLLQTCRHSRPRRVDARTWFRSCQWWQVRRGLVSYICILMVCTYPTSGRGQLAVGTRSVSPFSAHACVRVQELRAICDLRRRHVAFLNPHEAARRQESG
ncbi:hypothetical protein C8Q74DRAFT_151601 [Fomes fomentarius]|nr:hypothetical protein C8Q74DRAFT_151601 [Fomes fomentarius]